MHKRVKLENESLAAKPGVNVPEGIAPDTARRWRYELQSGNSHLLFRTTVQHSNMPHEFHRALLAELSWQVGHVPQPETHIIFTVVACKVRSNSHEIVIQCL